ncbi:MAG: hypothetical protein Q4F84_04435 [Fibrobacter sp.]|nr:hypothetical protein [Fibrobacter sp.]
MENLDPTNNQAFEDGIREIMSFGEKKAPPKPPTVSFSKPEMVFSSTAEKPQPKKSYTLIRIIAALTTLGLFVLFALQVSSK